MTHISQQVSANEPKEKGIKLILSWKYIKGIFIELTLLLKLTQNLSTEIIKSQLKI